MGNCGYACIQNSNTNNDLRKKQKKQGISKHSTNHSHYQSTDGDLSYSNQLTNGELEYSYQDDRGSQLLRLTQLSNILSPNHGSNFTSFRQGEAEWDDYFKSKRNNHLFLKDYSSMDESAFFLNNQSSHIPSMNMLHEQKAFLFKVKFSAEEKIKTIEKKIEQILTPDQPLLILGNKVVSTEKPLDSNQYTKLIIEVKYVHFHQTFSRQWRPRITISQPVDQLQKDLRQLVLFNSPDVNILDTLVESFHSGKYEGSAFLSNDKMIKKKQLVSQSSENFSQNFGANLTPTKQPAKRDSIGSISFRPIHQKKPQEMNPESFMIVDGSIFFHTTRAEYPRQFKKTTLKNGLVSDESHQMPIWHEAFVLYFEKDHEQNRDLQFSIELTLHQKGKRKFVVGKKQTFMLYQFQNEQIIEQEIPFGSVEAEASSHSTHSLGLLGHQIPTKGSFHQPFSKNETAQAKLNVKLQLFDDEVESLQTQLMCLNERHRMLESGIERIDQLIEEKQYHMRTSKDSMVSPPTKTTTTPKDFKDVKNPSGLRYDERYSSSIRESMGESQKAGFYQCQLMFVDQNLVNSDLTTPDKLLVQSSNDEDLLNQINNTEVKKGHKGKTISDIMIQEKKSCLDNRETISNIEYGQHYQEDSSNSNGNQMIRSDQKKRETDNRQTVESSVYPQSEPPFKLQAPSFRPAEY